MGILENPTKANIATLQSFLTERLPDKAAKDLLLKTSLSAGLWDGKYGETTNNALNAYLEEYTTFTNAEA
jgi:hypothetical protein